MKLSMACVAVALSLTAVGCADEVGTSGDSEISVKDTNYKADQDPKTRTIFPGAALHEGADFAAYDFTRVFFPDQRGVSAESLPPRSMDVDTTQTDVGNPGIGEMPLTPQNVMEHPKHGVLVAYPTLVVQHNNNGLIDHAEVMMEDGTYLCRIVQTRQTVLENTCL